MSEIDNEVDSKVISLHPNVIRTRSDFLIGKVIGEGSYSSVFHAKDKFACADSTAQEYALKRLDKLHLIKENKCQQAVIEKNILLILNHYLIVKCKIHFEDSNYLYLCLELAKGGELQQMIKSKRIINEEKGIMNQACDLITTKFYIAEIIIALEYLDSLNIIHRDLKPENILLTLDGHIKITDFGSACYKTDQHSVETIGTAEYLSPEFQELDEDSEIGITRSCDLWALGIIFYQMLVGKTPFNDVTEYLIFDKIMNHVTGKSKLEFNENISQNAQNLINLLLIKNPSERIGAGDNNSENGFETLKKHPFFCNLNFNNLIDEIPPYKPNLKLFRNSKYMFDGDSIDWDNESENLDEKIKWTRFFEGEMQIYAEQVYKRKYKFSLRKLTRQLILTNKPRLIYVDPKMMEHKGEIEIKWNTKEEIAKLTGINSFEVLSCHGRSYYIECFNEESAGYWVDLINQTKYLDEDLNNKEIKDCIEFNNNNISPITSTTSPNSHPSIKDLGINKVKSPGKSVYSFFN